MTGLRHFDWRGLWKMGKCCERLNGDQGGALVEMALTIPLLLALLLGAAEFGMASYAAVEVENAAMAGVQYGTSSPNASGDITGIQNAAANDAANITLGTTTVSHTCICANGTTSTCLPTDCTGSHPETILKVQTQTTFTPGINVPGFPTSFTIYGQAVQKVLQ
jgi:Flp pilus assembly protein TadG